MPATSTNTWKQEDFSKLQKIRRALTQSVETYRIENRALRKRVCELESFLIRLASGEINKPEDTI